MRTLQLFGSALVAGQLAVAGAVGRPLTVEPPDSLAWRVATQAFGEDTVLEVRDLPRETAGTALAEAIEAIREVEMLVDPAADHAGGLARLDASPGRPVTVDPALAELLLRTQEFCLWSEGANGPLGGRLYRLWEEHLALREAPHGQSLAQAAESAECDRIEIDPAAGTAGLRAGSSADLRSFATGFAVDRAITTLRRAGSSHALVTIGRVYRSVGAGPSGDGWTVALPAFPGTASPYGHVVLRDQALTFVEDYGEEAGDRPPVPFLDHRNGRRATGVLAVVVVTELAVDAQGLANTLLVTGNREGMLRLGRLEPQPSVLWVLGSGSGAPLFANHRWSSVEVRKPDVDSPSGAPGA